MSETPDTLVQEYVTQLETQKPSFDKIERLYETHRENKEYLEALSIYFDAKEYDETVYRDIRDYTKNFNYYPESKDKHFIKKISEKHEFGMYKVDNDITDFKDKCSADFFELAPHQLFLKNWMSPTTPYRSLLVFHGVGVGKTCSGISMAENFKDVYGKKDKRIIILASSNIQLGWKKTIFTPGYGDAQCTGDTYHIANGDGLPIQRQESKTKKIIKSYYELHGYTAFANSVRRLLKKKMRSFQGPDEDRTKREDEILCETFSDRVLIIDEVHNIRTADESVTRDRIHYIMRVIQASKNLRLILLTANPMFNQPDEIVWILNMMLLNDGRPIITDQTIFKEGVFTTKGADIIRATCRGYVSYLRGENPVSFPIRLYPTSALWSDQGDRDHVGTATPFTDISGKSSAMTFMKVYCSEIAGDQKTIYEKEMGTLDSLDSFQLSEDKRLLQMGNIVYPIPDEDCEITECYGDGGFDRCFKETKGPTYSYRRDIPEFLQKGTLGNHSCKMKAVLDSIDQSEGIVFIYTNWVKGGLLPMILALEQNGYQRYDKRVTLQSESKSQLNGSSYMVISNIGGLTTHVEEELRVLCSQDNSRGSKIKIVIGTSVAAEGLDFKNVRSIHILEPWRNINKLEQVIGRGVRNCSHKHLEPEERNVTIYLHNMMLSPNQGSFDTYLYKYCEEKAMNIGEIENILKEEAIDRCLFEEMNLILKKTDVDPVQAIPALKGSRKITIYPKDQPYSRICSVLPSCPENTCDRRRGPASFNEDTLHISYSQGLLDVYKKRISLLCSQYLSFTYQELQEILEEHSPVHEMFLDYALNQMLEDQYMLKNPQGETGYLIQKGDIFLFQPDYTNDEHIPYYYRMNRGRSVFPDYALKMRDKKQNTVTSDKQSFTKETVQGLFDTILNYTYNGVETFVLETFNLSDQTKWGYVCDRLLYQEKLILMYGVLSMITDQMVFDDTYSDLCEFLRNHLKHTFLSYDEDRDTFELGEKHLYGFFVYHPKNRKTYCYQYTDRSIVITNQVDSRDIMGVLKKTKQDIEDADKIWGFMVYVPRKKQGTSTGIVCVIIDPKDKRKSSYTYPTDTPGVIIADSHPKNKNLICSDPFQFLQIHYPEYMKRGESSWDSIQTSKAKVKKYAAMIELFTRENQNLLSQELAWLKYL